MGKIKTYFRVLFSSLNPVKAKKYFIAFKPGKAISFLFITMVLLWLAFFYIDGWLIYLKLKNSKQLKDSVTKVSVKLLEGGYKVLKELPFSSVMWDADTRELKVLGLNQPYLINFYTTDFSDCNLDTLSDPYIQKQNNMMLISCTEKYFKEHSSDEILKDKPFVGIYINTLKPDVLLEGVENRNPGGIDIILTSRYASIAVQERVDTPVYKERKVYFEDFVKDVEEPLSIFLPKDKLLTLIRQAKDKTPQAIDSLFEVLMPTLFSIYTTTLVPIFMILVVIISILPLTTFSLYFNFLGSLLLATGIGILLSHFKAFNGTDKTFSGNLPLGALATTTAYLYRWVISTALLGMATITNSFALVGLAGKFLFNSGALIAVLIIVIFILKKQAFKELAQEVSDK